MSSLPTKVKRVPKHVIRCLTANLLCINGIEAPFTHLLEHSLDGGDEAPIAHRASPQSQPHKVQVGKSEAGDTSQPRLILQGVTEILLRSGINWRIRTGDFRLANQVFDHSDQSPGWFSVGLGIWASICMQ